MAAWDTWVKDWETARDLLVAKGGRVVHFEVAPPATAKEVLEVEKTIGKPLPASFKRVVTQFSKEVNIHVRSVDKSIIPQTLRTLFFRGEMFLIWSLEEVVYLEQERQTMLERSEGERLLDPWRHVCILQTCANGDDLVFDESSCCPEAIRFLSIKHAKGNGYLLAENFEDLIHRMTLLALPGYDDNCWLPFAKDSTSMLDPHCENARIWREWLGFQPSTK
ncbi:hypothetical protein CA54_47630 [Symmachiella macrocystis]|uniref:Knr4/Smi1-like domain-containing protein n=2 Tax=Symmachiella macrocystis TaxID=2527985 RepID=A0A5C6BDD9_9PLAN|nr:hypothetical protein CA54_47630 [Symmachiella macrocystis]